MSNRDEAPKTRKRRRRRSLRVPVDEVPRPTQSPEGAGLVSEEIEIDDGGATMEMPAFSEDGRAALEGLTPESADDEELMGRPRDDDSDDPLDEAPTVVRSAPSEEEEEERAASEKEEDEFDAPATIVSADAPDDGETLEQPAPRPVGAGPSVEVDLDAELSEEDGASDEEGASEFDAGPTQVEDAPDESEPAAEAEGAGADEAGAHEAASDVGDAGEAGEAESSGDGEASEGDEAEEEATETVPSVGVIVQRVVAVASSSTSPPPPEEDDEDDLVTSFDTVPGGAFAVDVDMDEPDVTFEEEPTEGADIEELDVDLEEGEGAAASEPAEAAELSEQEAAELLEEEAEAAEARQPKKPSKPPPPPGNQKAGAQPGNAPPPPPTEVEAKSAAPQKKSAAPQKKPAAPQKQQPKRKKARKKWWEDLFNDDYLRTVPIPHPKTITRQCDFIEQRFGLAQGATILDVGCGLGLHAVELTRRGYLVVGLDLSLPMLSRAADEAQEHGFKINFLHADMRQMNFDGAFDAVLCWGTTFGYFDDETNKQVIERLYRALKPRGLLLLDVVNRDYVIAGQPNLVWFEGDGCVVMEETQMNYITSRLEVKRNVILDDGRQRDTLYSLRLYSLHELGQLLHLQGFRVVEVTGREAHPGVFFGADSPKLLIMAERRPQGPPSPPSRPSSTEMSAVAPSQPPSASEPPSEPAEPPEEEEEEEPAASEEPAAEPSEDVNAALAETLESSEELDLGEELDPDELEAEDIEEEELAEQDAEASSTKKPADEGADESE